MAVTQFKTYIAGEVLTASDLNSSLTRITDNGEDLAWPATKAKDLNGQELILDADGDTGILADTDDRIDFRIQNVDLFRFDGSVSSVVNGLDFTASISGGAVVIQPQGSDTIIDISIIPKGGHASGNLILQGQIFS